MIGRHHLHWLGGMALLLCLLTLTAICLAGCKSKVINPVVVQPGVTNIVVYVPPDSIYIAASNPPAINITNVPAGLVEHPVSLNITGLPLPLATNNLQVSGSLNLTHEPGAEPRDLSKWLTVVISFFSFIVAALTFYLNRKLKIQEKRAAVSGNVAAILARAQGLLEKTANLKQRLDEFRPSDDPDNLDVPRRIEAGDLNGELLKMTGKLEQIKLKALEILDHLNNKTAPGNKMAELEKLHDVTQQTLKSFESEGDVTLSGYKARIDRLLGNP